MARHHGLEHGKIGVDHLDADAVAGQYDNVEFTLHRRTVWSGANWNVYVIAGPDQQRYVRTAANLV